MKITQICIGKTSSDYLIQGVQEYEKRLKHYVKFESIIIPYIKNSKNLSEGELKNKEGEEILKRLDQRDMVILLDEKGKVYSSVEFSSQVQSYMGRGIKNLVFVIGGAYGFSDAIYQRGDGKISLSRMTFSHQMIRLIFIEQLYRAMTILRGEPYHHV